MIQQTSNVYDELAEFLASLSPEKVLNYRPSERKQKRLSELLHKKSSTALSREEEQELEGYFILERIIRTAKAHALTLLNHRQIFDFPNLPPNPPPCPPTQNSKLNTQN